PLARRSRIMVQVIRNASNPLRITSRDRRGMPESIVLGTPAPVAPIAATDGLEHRARDPAAESPTIRLPLWRRRNPCGNRVTAEESMRSGFRQHPQLGERRHESAGPPSHLYRGIELLLRDPGITVRDDGNVPVTGDPRRRVDGFGPVERSGNVVP